MTDEELKALKTEAEERLQSMLARLHQMRRDLPNAENRVLASFELLMRA